MADDLTDEERVAVGLAADLLGESVAPVLQFVAQHRPHQRRDLLPAQAPQPDPLDAALAPQVAEQLVEGVAAGQFGLAVGAENQELALRGRADEVLEQRQGLGVRPLEVVEDDDDSLFAGGLLQQPDRGRPQQVALGLGVGLLRRRQLLDAGVEARRQPRQLAAVAFDVAVDDALRSVVDIVGQRLGPWPVRGLEPLGAAPEQDRCAAFVQVEGRVGGEAGLPDPRLT